MASVNKLTLIGNLGSDPEITVTKSGQMCMKLSIATSERWTDKNNQKQEKTDWHRCTVWGKQAESLSKFLAKGMQVYVEGSLHYSTYEKDGEKRYSTDIKLSSVQVLTKKGANATTGAGDDAGAPDDEDPDVAAAMAGKGGATPPPF